MKWNDRAATPAEILEDVRRANPWLAKIEGAAMKIPLQLRWYKRLERTAAELAVFNPDTPLAAGKVKIEGITSVRAEHCFDDAAKAYRQIREDKAVYYVAFSFDVEDGWKYEP